MNSYIKENKSEERKRMRRTGSDQRNRENKTQERDKERYSIGNKNGGERKRERVERNE